MEVGYFRTTVELLKRATAECVPLVLILNKSSDGEPPPFMAVSAPNGKGQNYCTRKNV